MKPEEDDRLRFLKQVLDAETERFKRNPGEIDVALADVEEPWRYYDTTPLEGYARTFDKYQCFLEAGRGYVQAESAQASDYKAFAEGIVYAQAALLRLLSTYGNAQRKSIGQKKGGNVRNETIEQYIFEIAEDLIQGGASQRGLARKVSDSLFAQHEINKTEAEIRIVIKRFFQEGILGDK